jgi:hypothetical protein
VLRKDALYCISLDVMFLHISGGWAVRPIWGAMVFSMPYLAGCTVS